MKNKIDKNLKLTNVLQITWELPERVPAVVPKSYHEAMAYLTGDFTHIFEIVVCRRTDNRHVCQVFEIEFFQEDVTS